MSEELVLVDFKLNKNSNRIRKFICREIEDASYPKGRSLLITNVPPLVKPEVIKQCFEKIADVENIVFREESSDASFIPNRNNFFNEAVIVFRRLDVIDSLKDNTYPSPLTLMVGPKSSPYLFENFKNHYNNTIINTKEYKEKIDKVVELYDKRGAVKKKIEEFSKEADEDGWITVKRARPHSLNRDLALLEKSKAKQLKKKRLEANVAEVYQYRMKEKKLGRLRDLRKKFEEDKFKIAQMKSGRKFRPT
jgi:ribosomal RNA-processing protein 7